MMRRLQRWLSRFEPSDSRLSEEERPQDDALAKLPPDPVRERLRGVKNDLELGRLEMQAKHEIAVGYTAAGFPEAAQTMEEQVERIRARVDDLENEVSSLKMQLAARDELLDLIGVDGEGS